MPTFEVTAPDGKKYRVNTPQGGTQQQAIAYIADTYYGGGKNTEAENALERTGAIGNAAAWAADIPLQIGEGLTGVGKSFTDVFGAGNAASKALDAASQYMHDLRSSESRGQEKINAARTAAAQGKGTWEEIKAAGENFLSSPLESTANLVGSAIPFIGAAATGVGEIGLLGMGAVSGAGTIKGDIYDAMYKAARQHGASDAQAAEAATKAQEYTGENVDQIAIGTALGAAASATGLPRMVAKRAATEVIENIAEREVTKRSMPKGMLAGAAEEAIPEAVQEGQEQYAENIAQKRAGYDVDPWAGVAGRAAAAGIASLLPGAYGGHGEVRAKIAEDTQEEFDALPADATPEVKNAAVERFMQRGFSQEEAQTVVDRMAAQKAALARMEAEDAAAREAAMAERTAGVEEPGGEPDISAPGMQPMPGAQRAPITPPPVDTEEQAAMQRAYEQESQMVPSIEDLMAEPAPELNVAEPSLSLYPTGEELVPARAKAIIAEGEEGIQRYADAKGIDTQEAKEQLDAAAAGITGIRYSRAGRRAKDTQTASLFGEMQMQEAPGEAAKRDEFNALRFAPEEEKAQRQEQAAAEAERSREQTAAWAKEMREQRDETLGDIEYALRAQAPENAVYKVLYEPEDTSGPYKLVAETELGKKPELIHKAKTLQEFSDRIYGDMQELTPYIPAGPTAMQEIEAPARSEQEAPTAATRMVQDFVAEVDAAHQAGQIDNSQRAELLGRLQRPNAYRTLPDGRTVPNDAIAKLEAAALNAASEARNASKEDAPAATEALAAANEKLIAATKNSLLNPARAALKTMVEMRQDEKVGARIRAREAQTTISKFEGAARTQREFGAKRKPGPQKYELKPGTPEGAEQLGIADIGENKTEAAQRATLRRKQSGTSATGEAVFGALPAEATAELHGAKKELRESKIDLAESRVSKYRKGADKQAGGPPKVVPLQALQDLVDAVTSKWKSKSPVLVVESITDIADAALRRAILRDNALDAKGLVAPNGTVYLIADNLLSLEDAKAVLFHEGLGHIGLEKLFRNNLDSALVAMYRGNGKLRADVDKWRQDNSGAYDNDANPLARAVEEVLAERSEGGQLNRTLFQKIAAIVRNFARRLGMNLTISDGDVAAILSMAHDKVVKGDEESAVVKGLRYVNVWHGSPHDFGQFDTDKIGSGEGAQIFGWGLYFTDTKQIAEKQYRDRLAGVQYTVGDKTLSEWADENIKPLGIPYTAAIHSIEKYLPQYASVEEMLDSTRMTLEQEVQHLADVEAEAARDRGPEDESEDGYIRSIKNAVARWGREVAILEKLAGLDVNKVSAGKLYNVELAPKADEWLLWDKPITRQSDKVKAALEQLGMNVEGSAELDDLRAKKAALYEAYHSLAEDARAEHRRRAQLALEGKAREDSLAKEQAILDKVRDIARQQYNINARVDELERTSPSTGEDAYNVLSKRLGSPKEASLALLDVGIRGNKYLDGNSRGAGIENPAYNYVVFDDSDVSLLAKYSRPKTSKATAKKLEESDTVLSKGAERVKNTNSTTGLADGLGDMAKGHDSAPFREGLTENWEAVTPKLLEGTAKAMPTSGLLSWVKSLYSPQFHAALQSVDENVHKMVSMKNRINEHSDKLARKIRNFTDKYGSQQLSDAMFTSRINEVSPDEFGSRDEAMAKNKAIAEIERLVLKNSNDKALAKRLVGEIKELALRGKEAVRMESGKVLLSGALREKLKALSATAIDRSKTSEQVGQLAEMTRRIRDTYAAWDKLGEQKNGQQIYLQMREFYKDMFDAELAMLDERINSITDKEQAARITDMRAKLMREIATPDERKKAGDLFYNLDANLFSKDYFPLMREGKYWLRISEDKSKGREEEFHTFETLRDQRRAQKAVAKRLGVDPEENDGAIKIGYNIAELQDKIRGEDALMQRVFDITDKVRRKDARGEAIDINDLADAIYETWLHTTPERSVRRRLMHAKEIAGFSPNVELHFRQQASSYANQLSKLAYAGKVRADIGAARESANDKERPTTERAKMNIFVSEFENRANQELRPDPHNALANFINRASFYYYLTSARTAFTQVLSVPIRVVPRLWRDYGFTKGTAMWIKYMRMWDSLGRVKIEHDSTSLADRIGDRIDAIMPSVNGSHFVKNNADLQWAMRAGKERGILEMTHDTLVQNERATPKGRGTGAKRVAQDIAAVTGKAMGFMFTGMENISRQASYYMTFELALDKYRKENPGASIDEARNYALQQAVDVVRGTLGDFSSWERPSLAKNNYTRALFLFKMHPLLQTKFMVGAMRDIVKGAAALRPGGDKTARAEAAGAMKELGGVMLMAGMFGGLMGGLPLYTVMAHALAESFDQEDDDDVRKLMGIDPRTAYDADIMFRTWMNEKFGAIQVGNTNLSDILVHGPIAAMTNTELSSAVSLDLKNMWFRDAVAGDTLEDTAIQTAIANIAGLSMVHQIFSGLKGISDGDMAGGVKKLLPAFARSWAKAAFDAEQGVTDRKGNVIIPKQDITAADTARTLLGFRAMKLARWQDYYITRAKNDKRIEAEKQDILDTIGRKYYGGEFKTPADFQKFWQDTVVPFNRTYPSADFVITKQAIMKSLTSREKVRERTLEGMQVDKKGAAQTLKSAAPFRP